MHPHYRLTLACRLATEVRRHLEAAARLRNFPPEALSPEAQRRLMEDDHGLPSTPEAR